MIYVVRVSCHIYLDIHLDIYLNIYLNVYLTLPYLRIISPLAASRPPLYYLAPQSVNAIKVHSLLLPSSSTVNLRS